MRPTTRLLPGCRIPICLPALALALTVVLSLSLAAPVRGQAAIGLSSVRAQVFENEDLFFYAPEFMDRFGWSFATGDFNGDGADDLATGMPYDDGLVGSGVTDCGTVIVRYGSAVHGLVGGLATTVLSQFLGGSPNPPETDDRLGMALAAGDFNGDGIDDLAVSAPGDREWHDEAGGYFTYGSVEIHYGLVTGIQDVPEHHLHWWNSVYEQFGWSLAAGDFNGDNYDDLAVGVPSYHGYYDGEFWQSSGLVSIYHGHFGGMVPVDRWSLTQESESIHDVAQLEDGFGFSVAAADFDGDGFDDLAVGVPGEEGSGALQVVMGSAGALNYAENAIWLQGDLPGGSASEAGDRFGHSLAAGDFDGDGYQDLAVGAPFEDLGASGTDAGEISVLYGGPTGDIFTLARTEHFRQSTIFGSGTYDTAGDKFGYALAAGDFERDGYEDLAIGQPGEEVGGADRGGVTILNGGPPPASGLYERFRFLAAGINGVPPGVQNSADMGHALATGDFDASGTADLAIGSPYRDLAAAANAGLETVLYGSLFGDGFESNSLFAWSASAP
jgi:hypothetical protein